MTTPHADGKQGERNSRAPLWITLLLIAGFMGYRVYVEFLLPPPAPDAALVPNAEPERTEVHVALKRSDFTFFLYTPGESPFATQPKAVILFGSGDGGFDGWENRVCKALQADGYALIGFDCAHYAATDYDMATLQADMSTITQNVLSRFGDHPPPLILGGWSMGAVQSVAAAAGPHPPAGVTGVLVISPGSRGRYGLRPVDRWDVPPTGEGTFAMTDFAQSLDGLRVVQWDGKLDFTDSAKWLDTLTATHKAYTYTLGIHDYNAAGDDFLLELRKSLEWLLSDQK